MLIGIDGNEANIKNRVGSGQYTFELLQQFSKEKNRKFVVYLKDKPVSDLPRQTPNYEYKVFGPKKFWTQFALPINLTFGQKPDVFFSPAHYGPRFSRVPYVVTIHDLSYLHFPRLFKKNDLYQLTSWSKYSIENSARIIVPSHSTKDDVVKNYQVNPSKITVTYEGYDKYRFKPQPKTAIDKIKRKYKIIGDYIIFVGTLQPRKNIERLIEAFASLIQNSKFEIENYKI
ncbi:MAG: glycosyltransferase, partial [Candidatus Curtissbacteria bacterium]